MDDVFFEVFAKDIPACQEILRTILEDDRLIVEEVIVQSSERNLYGRSVRLDALCTLGNGSKCNIEVQRSDRDNHMKRARFNASVITTRSAEPGERFQDVLELYIVYISEFDFLGGGLTTYHVDKTIRENGMIVDDGLHCYPAFYLVLNHPTFNQIKKKHGINYSDKFYIRLLYAVSFVLSY